MPEHLFHQAARRVVRGYPQPWRERYEAEMLALLDDSSARLRDVVDLGRGLVVERVRSMFEPGDRPGFLAALVSLTVLARALAVALPPILAGLAAQYWLGPLPRQVATSAALMSALFVVVLIALRVLGKCWPTLVSFESGKPQLSDRAAWIYLGLAIPLTFLMSWSSNGIMQSLNALWWFYPVWDQMAARRPWQTEMARAIQNLRSAQYQMKWARMELQRCQDLVAEGAPAPLQEARDVIERLTRQQDEALATLHGLGYRASLSNPDPEPRTRTLHRT